jgi:hypothetical protein
MCENIILPNKLELINISGSRLSLFPDISGCNNLKICKINNSLIQKFTIEYTIPTTVIELNLEYNFITNEKFTFNKLNHIHNINFNNNNLIIGLLPPRFGIFLNQGRNYNQYEIQRQYNIHNQNTNNLMRKLELQRHSYNKQLSENNQRIRTEAQRQRMGLPIQQQIQQREIRVENIPEIDNQLFGSQNVHLSSIVKSVVNSVQIMQKFIKDNELIMYKYDFIEPVNPVKAPVNPVKAPVNPVKTNNFYSIIRKIINFIKRFFCFRYYEPTVNKTEIYEPIINETVVNGPMVNETVVNASQLFINNISVINRALIYKYISFNDTHSITKLTLKQTFEIIWTIVYFKYTRNEININDVCERIVTEMTDGILMCFTGKYNRLINSMVGIIDGINIGFSENELLQLEFGRIITKYNEDNSKYSFDKLYKDAEEILKDISNEQTKSEWMNAIRDLC